MSEVAEGRGVSEEWIREHELLESPWYHEIELAPELFTPGKTRGNLAVSRELVKRCELEGQSVLDIGAMDGLMSLLALRRGARRVVAYDRVDSSPRIDFLKKVLDVDFDYVSKLSLHALPERLREMDAYPFDVVFFCGVLYHMFDPMAGLSVARGLVRNGGLLVIETAAVIEAGFRMHFNAGRLFRATNYWQMSLDCLDYLCKLLQLEPIGCSWVGGHALSDELRGCRAAVVCRAVEKPLPVEGDDWYRRWTSGGLAMGVDLSEHLDLDEYRSPAGRELEYGPVQDDLIRHSDTGTVDILRTVEAMPPLKPWQPLGRLPLGATE